MGFFDDTKDRVGNAFSLGVGISSIGLGFGYGIHKGGGFRGIGNIDQTISGDGANVTVVTRN